jgi:4-hydroxy-tetrahydrodipicolinate reductase
MKKPRVIVNGAFGKMGTVAVAALTDSAEFDVVACLGHQDNLAQRLADAPVDIVVDLTRADSVFANSMTIIQAGSRPVIGTSGLKPEQITELQRACAAQALGGLIVPNFSLSAVLMMQCAARIAHYLPDVEIVEGHHPQKRDAPSATALKTAHEIAQAWGNSARDIPIHSIRLPGILAQQDVIFGQSGETLTLSHRTLDRGSFMPGLLLACRRVMQLNQLYYGLEHVLD